MISLDLELKSEKGEALEIKSDADNLVIVMGGQTLELDRTMALKLQRALYCLQQVRDLEPRE